jgi:fructose-bisphosphate aldolase class I
MDGAHTLDRCAYVTERVLQAVFDALFMYRVSLEDMLLKPNMVTPGDESKDEASVREVAAATLRTLGRHVPPTVPGIVFLSGGQQAELATEHLNAINRHSSPKPWPLTFSFGRALQDEAMEAWRGRDENVPAAQRALVYRLRCCAQAATGRYHPELERNPTVNAPEQTPWQTQQ